MRLYAGCGECTVSHGRSKIARKTIPVHVAKCGGDHIPVSKRLNVQLFQRRAAYAAAFSVRRTVFE